MPAGGVRGAERRRRPRRRRGGRTRGGRGADRHGRGARCATRSPARTPGQREHRRAPGRAAYASSGRSVISRYSPGVCDLPRAEATDASVTHTTCGSQTHHRSAVGRGGRGVGWRRPRGASPSRAHTRLSQPTSPPLALGRRRLRVQPRLVGPRRGGTRPRGRCSARCTALRGVQPARRGPAERVEQDQRPARVDPRIVERRAGHVAVPAGSNSGSRAGGSSQSSIHVGGALVEVRPRTGRSARCPLPRAARRSTAATRARERRASAATSCSRPATSPTAHTIASKIGWPRCVIDTRIDSARLASRSVVTSRSTGRRSRRRRGSGRRA